MAESRLRRLVNDSGHDNERHGDETGASVRFGVWLVLSTAFLGFVAFGSVEARIWRSGRLLFMDRSVAHVWTYLGRHLPEMPAQSLITVLYYLSVAVLLVGTVAGLWYFLQPDEVESAVPAERDEKAATPDHV